MVVVGGGRCDISSVPSRLSSSPLVSSSSSMPSSLVPICSRCSLSHPLHAPMLVQGHLVLQCLIDIREERGGEGERGKRWEREARGWGGYTSCCKSSSKPHEPCAQDGTGLVLRIVV